MSNDELSSSDGDVAEVVRVNKSKLDDDPQQGLHTTSNKKMTSAHVTPGLLVPSNSAGLLHRPLLLPGNFLVDFRATPAFAGGSMESLEYEACIVKHKLGLLVPLLGFLVPSTEFDASSVSSTAGEGEE